MTVTIGLVANVYNEINALPGWLETHLPFFDDVRVLHAGPGGAYSTDGTMELLEKWHIPVVMDSIDEGFGVVRTRAMRLCPCDYVMVLDADERFYPTHRILYCGGTPTPDAHVILGDYNFYNGHVPDWGGLLKLGADLSVGQGAVYDQGAWLREMLEGTRPDGVVTARRHWHDFSMRRPTQHWVMDPDWQLRTVRCDPSIFYDASTRMHERLVGVNSTARGDVERGPFFDHFHFTFKCMEVEQRRHDVEIYDAIHEGRLPPQRRVD